MSDRLIWRVTFEGGETAEFEGDSFVDSTHVVTVYRNSSQYAVIRSRMPIKSIVPIPWADVVVRDAATGRFRRLKQGRADV